MFSGLCAWAILPKNIAHTTAHNAHNQKCIASRAYVIVRKSLTGYSAAFNLYPLTTQLEQAQMKNRAKKTISAAIEKGLFIFVIFSFIVMWIFSAYEMSRFIANN
jgi:hypothetical protein